MGIIERIGAFSGTESAKAINTAHSMFQERLGDHGHHGRALLESIAEVCRAHPNMVGIVAGLVVEQFLVYEKHHHEAEVAAHPERHPGDIHLPPEHQAHAPKPAHTPVLRTPAPAHAPLHMLRLDDIRPGRLAMEVFGALLLLKFSAGVAKAMRKKKHKKDIWFAPAAKIHLFSGTLAAYYIAKSLKAKKVSSWRNAACALFLTDALKPLLKPRKGGPLPRPAGLKLDPEPAPAAPGWTVVAHEAAPVEPAPPPAAVVSLAEETPAGHA